MPTLSNPQLQALKRSLSDTCKHLEASEELAAGDPGLAQRLHRVRSLLQSEIYYVEELQARSVITIAKPWAARAL